MGMAMTEKQGGSDVRANLTARSRWTAVARRRVPADRAQVVLLGPDERRFPGAGPGPGGLSCFLVPRWNPDGERNTIHLQRLKDKLGNRSNASRRNRVGCCLRRLIGEEGRGVPTIIEMVAGTRLDCVIGSAALMRQAMSQAAHHAAHRKAFGRKLIDQPLMAAVLADLEVETEAAVALMVRVAASFDAAPIDPAEAALGASSPRWPNTG